MFVGVEMRGEGVGGFRVLLYLVIGRILRVWEGSVFFCFLCVFLIVSRWFVYLYVFNIDEVGYRLFMYVCFRYLRFDVRVYG